MRVTLRPTIPADLPFCIGEPLAHRIKAITAEVEGRVIGIGGLVFRPDGVWASLALCEEARRYKVAMHRAAKLTLAMARAAGIRRVLALAEADRPGAAAWLERLGFRATEIAGRKVYVWEAGPCGTTATAPRD